MTAKKVGRILRCSPLYTEAAFFIHRERREDEKRKNMREELCQKYREAGEKQRLSNKQIRSRVMEDSFPATRGGYRKVM